jgi:hypothetical protein
MTGKKTAKEAEPSTVAANDSNDLKGKLKNIGGSRSDHWNSTLANQTLKALWLEHSEPATREKQCSATVATWSAWWKRRGVGIKENRRINPMLLDMHRAKRCGAKTRKEPVPVASDEKR